MTETERSTVSTERVVEKVSHIEKRIQSDNAVQPTRQRTRKCRTHNERFHVFYDY